tara:strand:+ start:1857 stop:2084 length:228 start_codon:yes stop_codon:yes gene_type:complete
MKKHIFPRTGENIFNFSSAKNKGDIFRYRNNEELLFFHRRKRMGITEIIIGVGVAIIVGNIGTDFVKKILVLIVE